MTVKMILLLKENIQLKKEKVWIIGKFTFFLFNYCRNSGFGVYDFFYIFVFINSTFFNFYNIKCKFFRRLKFNPKPES